MPKSSIDDVPKPATKYDKIKTLPSAKFRRLTGVKPTVFARMVA